MKRSMAALMTMALLAVACGSGDDSGSTTAASTSSVDATATTSVATSPASSPPASVAPSVGGGTVNGDLSFTLAGGYTATWVGDGIKPDLELAPDGTPGIAYLTEALDGSISYANAVSGWTGETITEGYFYGPIGLAYSPDAIPYVAYHDHQDRTFVQDKGDLTIAVGADGWTSEAVGHPGHDGWDSTIAISTDGVIRAAGIDPAQFDRTEGVEYFELVGDAWVVTEIGSGPVFYEFNVSLAVAPDGTPALTYYDNNTADLMYAARVGDVWVIETVDSDGDVGRYSSLAFDGGGIPHISYLKLDSSSSGTVRYATTDGTGWAVSDVGSLDNIRTGFTGARRITAIAIDFGGLPHVMFSDETVVNYAAPDAGGWNITQLISAGARPLGQLVSFRLDANGTVHLAISERITQETGVIAYITG